jgi:hypothetical protein
MHQIRSERYVHQRWLDAAGYVDFRSEPGGQRRLTARGRANGQPVKPYIWHGHGNDRLRAQLDVAWRQDQRRQ